MILATSSSYSILESPNFKAFLKSLNPLFKPLSRYSLTMERIPRYASLVKKNVDEFLEKEKWVTISIDGWTTRANEGIYGVTVVTAKGNEFIYDTIELGGRRATSDNLMQSLGRIIKRIGPKKVVGLVTDGAANMRRLRDLAGLSYRHITGVYCLVHAFNLFCLSIFKDSRFEKCFELSCRVIKWFTRSAKLSAILKETNIQLNESPVKLSSIGTTRFSRSYDALSSLLKNKQGLKALAKDKTTELKLQIREIVQSDIFWEEADSLKTILEPLNKAVKATQKPCLRLSDACYQCIVVLFGTLTLASLNTAVLGTDTLNHISCCRSKLLGRYLKSDIYYLALVLDPSYACDFSDTRRRTTRDQLREYVLNYGGDLEQWEKVKSEFNTFLSVRSTIGRRKPLKYWEEESGMQCLPPFALSILSITSNAMSCERAFSTMGWINSQRRSNINKHNLVESAMIHRHLTTSCQTSEELTSLDGYTWDEAYNLQTDKQLSRLLSSSTEQGKYIIRSLSQQFRGDIGLSNFLQSNSNKSVETQTKPNSLFDSSIMFLFQ